MERLRRGARNRPDRAFRHSAPGFCPICEVRIDSALDMHMLNFHLELAQLWHCLVEWCAVWKGSVRGCLDLHGTAWGFDILLPEECGEVFPSVDGDQRRLADGPFVRMCRASWWTHASSMRPDVDWYICTVYPRIRFLIRRSGGGGGGVIPRLLSFVARAMTIAQLTQDLHSCVGGAAWPGTSRLLSRWRSVAGTCRARVGCRLPRMLRCWGILRRRCVRRGGGGGGGGGEGSGTQALLGSEVTEDDVIETMGETNDCMDKPTTIIPPPAGFSQFSWPYEDCRVNDGEFLFTVHRGPPGLCPQIFLGRPVVVPSLPLGSSGDESIFPLEVEVMVPPLGDVRSGPTADDLQMCVSEYHL